MTTEIVKQIMDLTNEIKIIIDKKKLLNSTHIKKLNNSNYD